MGSIPVSRPEPKRRSDPRRVLFPLASALAVIAFAVVALYFLTQPDDTPYVVAGGVDDFVVGEPVRHVEGRFYVVKQEPGEFLALYQKDPHLGCTVPWNASFEFRGRTGWFRNPCHNETYDLQGRCVSGPCIRGLDRFPVQVVGGEVRVNTNRLTEGPPLRGEYSPGQ